MSKKLRDVVTRMPPEEVPKHLRGLAQKVRQLLVSIGSSISRSNERDAVTNLAKRTAAELEQLASFYPSSIEGVAWCTRNLFEVNLVLRYVLLDPKHVNEWMGQAAGDEKEITEGLLSLTGDESRPEVRVLRNRLSQIDEICKRHGIEPSHPFRIADLARDVGRTDDYKALYKLFSKYVHPSSYVINMPDEDRRGDETLNIFLMHATSYSGDTYGRLDDWFKGQRPPH